MSELPVECASPPEASLQNVEATAKFKSFVNPALGVSMSCSIQLMSPIATEPGQQFFTPFANKTFDSIQPTESDAFFTAMGTGVGSSVHSDACGGGAQSSRRRVSMFAFAAAAAAAQAKPPVSLPCGDLPAIEKLSLEPDQAPGSGPSATGATGALASAPETHEHLSSVVSESNVALDLQPEASGHALPEQQTERLAAIASPAGDLTVEEELSAPEPDLLQEGTGETAADDGADTDVIMEDAFTPAAKGEPSDIGLAESAAEEESAPGSPPEHLPAAQALTPGSKLRRGASSATDSARKLRQGVTAPKSAPPKSARKAKPKQLAPATGDCAEQSGQTPARRRLSTASEVQRGATPSARKPLGSACRAGSARAVAPASESCGTSAGSVSSAAAEGDNGGAGTPLLIKRIKNAGDKSPAIESFSAMKAPPAYQGMGRLAAVGLPPLEQEDETVAGAAENGPVGAGQKQKSANAGQRKESTTGLGAAAGKKADPKPKAAPARKAAGAAEAGGRTSLPAEAPAPKQASGTAKAVPAAKPAAPQGTAASAKVLAAANRVAAAHMTKQAASAGHAAVPVTQKAEAKKQTRGGKSTSCGGAAAAPVTTAAVAADPALCDNDGATRVILTRKPNTEAANVTGVAACRYGRARTAAPPPNPAAVPPPANPHSPDKLPPSKRHAKPITSPSKKPRQDGAAAAGPRSTQSADGAGQAVATVPVAPAAPSDVAGRRSPILAKGPKPSPASTRRGRASLGAATASEGAPAHRTPSASARKASAAAAASASAKAPADSTPPQKAAVPKLDFSSLMPAKSAGGTPGSAVAADMVPLRQQPVSARSPSLLGGSMSARMSPLSPMVGVSPMVTSVSKPAPQPSAATAPPLSPVVMAMPAVLLEGTTTANCSEPSKQKGADATGEPDNVLAEAAQRKKGPEKETAAAGPAAANKAGSGKAAAAKQATAVHHARPLTARTTHANNAVTKQPTVADNSRPLTARPALGNSAGAKQAPAADSTRPLTARPALGNNTTKAQPVAARAAASSRPVGVHKPSTAPAPAETAAAAAAASKPSSAPHPTTAGATKPPPPSASADVTVKAGKAAVPAAKALSGPNRAGATALAGKTTNASEQPRPAAAKAPSRPTAAPAAPVRPAGAVRNDGDEKLQRRKQYEALLGRAMPAPAPVTTATAGATEAPEAAAAEAPTAPAAAKAQAPVGKASAKPAPQPRTQAAQQGSPPLTARGLVRKPEAAPAAAPVQPEARTAAAPMRRVGPDAARGLQAAQRSKAAAGAAGAKQPVSASAIVPAAGQAGSTATEGAPGVVMSAGARLGSDSAAPAAKATTTAHTPKAGQPPASRAPRFGTKASPTPSRMPARTPRMGAAGGPGSAGAKKAAGGAAAAAGTPAGKAPAATPGLAPMDISPAPQGQKDLSWLVDASPCASLAATPGAMAAVAAGFGQGGDFFGFGGAQDDVVACASPGAFGFGSAFGSAQPDSPVDAGRGVPPAFFSPVQQRTGGFDFGGKPPLPVAMSHGLPPLGGLGEAPGSTTTSRTNKMLTPGSVFQFARGSPTQAKANNAPTPTLFPQAKLRFSWDPAAAPAPPPFGIPPQPSLMATTPLCVTPGGALSGIEVFNGAPLGEATPTSLALAAGPFQAGDSATAYGSGGLGDPDASADRDLPAELAVPVQCSSPNTSPPEGFMGGDLGCTGRLGQGEGGDPGVVVFGGAPAGMGRTGRVVEDSFDALRISSMSYWPLLRDRENAGEE